MFRLSHYTILILLLTPNGELFTQQFTPWIALPKPTPHTLSRVHFFDSLNGWISGQNGVLMKTSDGGNSWKQKIQGTTGEIPNIFPRTHDDLWALEYQYPINDTSWFGTNILHSTNGGEEWSVQQYDSSIFRAIVFLDSLTGFLGGSYGLIVKTTDGGSTWYRVSDSALHKFPIYAMKFYSKEYGFAVGGQLEIAGIIWKTSDGGETWRSAFVSGDPVFNLHFFDSVHVLCGMGDIDQSGAGFLRSVDAGETWNFENTTIWGEPTAFAFRTIEDGWVPMGIAGICLRTSDDGVTWEQIPVPEQIAVYDISFPTAKNGFMIGHKGALFKFNPNILNVSAAHEPVTQFTLQQNFPNPFNAETMIAFNF